MLLYIYIHDLYIILSDNKMNLSDNKLIKNNNPLLNKNIYEFELDKNYDITKISNQNENNSIISEIVRIKTVDFIFSEKFLLIICYPYLYFGTTNVNDVLIKYKYKVSDIGIYKNENKEEENCLNIIITNQNENNGKNIDISIRFKNKEICDKITSELIKNFDKIKIEEKEIFKNYFKNEKQLLNE